MEDTDAPQSTTTRIKKHKACGFAYKVVTNHQDFQKDVVVWRDTGNGDVEEAFILFMYEEYMALEPLLTAETEMKELTEMQKRDYLSAKECYLCSEEFRKSYGLQKVRDHDHYTGDYIGAAHGKCNLERRTDKRLPIVFHNFRYVMQLTAVFK